MTVTILDAPAGSGARGAFTDLGAVDERELDGSVHARTQACLVAREDDAAVAPLVAAGDTWTGTATAASASTASSSALTHLLPSPVSAPATTTRRPGC